MTESRSSGSSESISTDLIAKLFNALPDEKSNELSEIEYCLFRLFSNLSIYGQNYNLLFIIFLLITWIQSFYCISIISLSFNLSQSKPDFGSRLFFFFVHFRPFETEANETYFYVINVICLVCVSTFFISLYLMHKRSYISPIFRTFMAIFIIEIPRILSITLICLSSELIFGMISNKKSDNYAQTAILTIYLLVFLFILAVCANTLYSSIFFYSGLFSSTASVFFFQCINIFIIFAFNAAHSILTEKEGVDVTAFALIIFGVFLICVGTGNFFFDIPYPAFLISHGFVQIFSGIIGIFENRHEITNYSETIVIMFFTYFLVYFLVYFGMKTLLKKLKTQFLTIAKEKKFKKLGSISDIMFLNYIYIGIHNNLECINDNSFVKYGLNAKPRPVWCMFRVYHLLGLLQKVPQDFEELRLQIRQNRQINQRHRYILYEVDRLIALRNISQVPIEMENQLSEFEARLTQYQQLRVTFMTEIAHNNEIAFIFLNALTTMKDKMLTNYACTLIEKYPNSPDILRLYAQFLSIVCQNLVGCSRWTTIADDIQKRVIQYADFTHVNVLFRHRSLQLEMMKHNAVMASVPLVKPRAPSILLFPTLHDNKVDLFGTNPNNHFSDKRSFGDIFMIIFSVIFGVMTFVYFLENFVNVFKEADDLYHGVEFLNSFSNYILHFSTDLHWPLLQIYNGTNETADIQYFKDNFDYPYGMSWHTFYQNYTFRNQQSERFKEAFLFIERDLYSVPSYNISLHINSQLEWILSRYTNLLQSIFSPLKLFNKEIIETQILLETISESYEMYTPLIRKFLNALLEYNNKLSNNSMRSISYWIFPIVIIAFIMFFLPFFVLYDIKKLADLFPKSDQREEENHHILHLYLKRDFTSFLQIYFYIIISVVLIIGFSLCLMFSSKRESNVADEKLYFDSSTLISKTHLVFAASTALTNILLSQMSNISNFSPNKTYIIEEINKCLAYLANSTYIYSLYYPFTHESFLLLVEMTYQVTLTDLQYSEKFTLSYMSIFKEQLVPLTISEINTLHQDLNQIIHIFRIHVIDLNLLFLYLSSIAYIFLIVNIQKLHYTVRMIIELLSGLSESSLSMTKSANLKRNNILDLVERPCALIDKSTRVIATNQLWLSFYDETFDAVIGRTIGELANTQEFISYDFEKERQLIVMSEIKEEAEAKNDLKNTKRDLRLLKSVSIPKKFLDVTEGTEEVGFLVVSKISLIPSGNDDLSPEVWINDASAMEQWITERCQNLEDVDILYESFREVTLLFGVNGKVSENMLMLSAINIAIDMLRWAVEWEWSSGSMSICITLSCGGPNKLVFSHNRFTMMESIGPPFEKQMRLRETMELNSIVCCDETAMKIKSMKFGFEFSECGNNTYIFTIPNMMFFRQDVSVENF